MVMLQHAVMGQQCCCLPQEEQAQNCEGAGGTINIEATGVAFAARRVSTSFPAECRWTGAFSGPLTITSITPELAGGARSFFAGTQTECCSGHADDGFNPLGFSVNVFCVVSDNNGEIETFTGLVPNASYWYFYVQFRGNSGTGFGTSVLAFYGAVEPRPNGQATPPAGSRTLTLRDSLAIWPSDSDFLGSGLTCGSPVTFTGTASYGGTLIIS